MLVLHTFVNGESGSTFVGLRRWASGARMAVNTLRKHQRRAIEDGWLYAGSKDGPRRTRAKTVYRLTVPDHVTLSRKDEELRDCLIADHGDASNFPSVITESVSLRRDTETIPSADSVLNRSDTDAIKTANAVESNSEHAAQESSSVSTSPPLCINGDRDLYHESADLYHPIVDTEVHRSFHSGRSFEGAGASACTALMKDMNVKQGEHQRPRNARELTDDQLHERLRKMRSVGVSTVGEALRHLGNYEDITAERVQSVIDRYGRSA